MNHTLFEYLNEKAPAIHAMLEGVSEDTLERFGAMSFMGLLANFEAVQRYCPVSNEAEDWMESAMIVLYSSKVDCPQPPLYLRLPNKATKKSSGKERVKGIQKEFEPLLLEYQHGKTLEQRTKFATVSHVGLLHMFEDCKGRRSKLGERLGTWLDMAMDVLNSALLEGEQEHVGVHAGYVPPSKRRKPEPATSIDWSKIADQPDLKPEVKWAKGWAAGGHVEEPHRKHEALKVLAFNYKAFTDLEREAILLAYHSQTEQGSLF